MTPATSVTLGGRYQLLDRLAVGGMGEVWCADDQVLGRAVAVKVLREEHAHDPTFRQRFRTEAQHAAMLIHPNVAQVFDFSEGDEERGEPPYLVMELIRGEPLSQLLAREHILEPELTWSIIGQASSALAAAHDAGLVHRDIKPGNLLLCPDGMLKVTDFGIARATGSASMTTTGNVLGTPHYISPEQVAGEPVSGATDFYALGVVAYECLTGHRLYDGDALSVLVAHRDADPPPLPDSVPAGLGDLVMALLDKDPSKRPTDGRAIAAQAERFNAPTVSMPVWAADPYPAERSGPPVPAPAEGAPAHPPTGVLDAPPAASRRTRSWLVPVALIGCLLVVSAAVLAVVLGGGHSTKRPSATSPAAHAVPVRVAAASAYGGSAGAPDHPEEAALAIDGNSSTSWYTQHYASAAFGSLRPGSGLLLDLGHPVAVRTLRLQLAVSGVAVQVRAGSSSGDVMSAPIVGQSSSAPTTWVLHPTTTARYWLVWFTRLAPNDGGYRAGVAEASFSR